MILFPQRRISIRQGQSYSLKALADALVAEWSGIPQAEFGRLIHSFQNRHRVVISGYTRASWIYIRHLHCNSFQLLTGSNFSESLNYCQKSTLCVIVFQPALCSMLDKLTLKTTTDLLKGELIN